VLSVELHSHSELSYDGRDPVEALLAQAERRELDALAVTDHDEISASLEAVDLAPEYGVIGIPGMEVSSGAGHVLALGVEELVPAGLSFQETIDRIHDLGGIAVTPHPYQESRSGVLGSITEAEITAADAIEIYNSKLFTGRANRQARELALRTGMPMTAGSDAHISEMIGRAVTRVETTERSVNAILSAICAGNTEIEGRRTPWHITIRQAFGTASNRVVQTLSQYLQ